MSDINSPATPAAQDSPASARLEAGLTAPDFTLPSDNGGSVALSALRGQNIILLLPCRDDSRLHHRGLRLPRQPRTPKLPRIHRTRYIEGSAGQAHPIPRARPFDVPPVVGC